ncbi:MAG: hypothetical protein O7E56_05015 [SAR324 cluster bacterium]|nr:hypothetical protein [SAR324 cluster bacterium]
MKPHTANSARIPHALAVRSASLGKASLGGALLGGAVLAALLLTPGRQACTPIQALWTSTAGISTTSWAIIITTARWPPWPSARKSS